jgi:hypothetical protein
MDLVVENQVIVELKATQGIAEVHFAQALSYMKARVCLSRWSSTSANRASHGNAWPGLGLKSA